MLPSGTPARLGRALLEEGAGAAAHLLAAVHGGELIEEAKVDPRFVRISDDLKPFITAYDPATWRSPKDAMAARFYSWEAA